MSQSQVALGDQTSKRHRQTILTFNGAFRSRHLSRLSAATAIVGRVGRHLFQLERKCSTSTQSIRSAMFISEMADSRRRCGYAMGGDKMGRQATLTRPPQKMPGAPTWRTGSIVLELINRPTNHQDSLWRRAALICATEPPRMGLGLGLPLALSALCPPPPLGALSTAHKQSQ